MPFFGPLDDLHDPGKIHFPENFSDPLEENEPLRYRLAREHCQKHFGKDEAILRQLSAKYQGLVAQVDRSVGEILKTLEELGLAENTIVVYTSDHGDMMGSHGMVEKQFMYEESARVPWLMRIPQMKGGSRRVQTPVSQIDIVPTLLDLMEHPSSGDLPGLSLVPELKGDEVLPRDVFIEWNPNSMRAVKGTKLASQEEIADVAQERTRAVVTPDGWKLCLSDRDKCQLFNLSKDPLETTNLFDSGRHQDVIKRLTKKIHGWQQSVGDEVEV
jgi:arylsulfatase A-like enzyme